MSNLANLANPVNPDSERERDVEILRRAEADYHRRCRVFQAIADFHKNNSGSSRRGNRV